MQDGPCGGYTNRTQQSLESRIHENVYVRFGGGPMEKYPKKMGNSPAAYPTLRRGADGVGDPSVYLSPLRP